MKFHSDVKVRSRLVKQRKSNATV